MFRNSIAFLSSMGTMDSQYKTRKWNTDTVIHCIWNTAYRHSLFFSLYIYILFLGFREANSISAIWHDALPSTDWYEAYHIISYCIIFDPYYGYRQLAKDDWATQRVQIKIPYIWYIGRNVRINIDFGRLLAAKFSLSVLAVPSRTIIMVKYFYYNSLCIPL